MARVHFPSLVANGENPKAGCVAEAPAGTHYDGINRGLFGPAPSSCYGPAWSGLGEVMLAAMAPSLDPRQVPKIRVRKA